mmetsp:Transcript_8624/g.18548  ORF Transcript_8624/g.18548 Transcript_8624/m.18548 type:complete len:164 (+) Transcript_8624:534-1025(+)
MDDRCLDIYGMSSSDNTLSAAPGVTLRHQNMPRTMATNFSAHKTIETIRPRSPHRDGTRDDFFPARDNTSVARPPSDRPTPPSPRPPRHNGVNHRLRRHRRGGGRKISGTRGNSGVPAFEEYGSTLGGHGRGRYWRPQRVAQDKGCGAHHGNNNNADNGWKLF